MLKRLLTYAGLMASTATMSMAQDYPMAANDVLSLRVVNWDDLSRTVQEWPAVTGEYRVGPDGMVVVPFAGRVEAAGRSPEDLESEIAERLRDRLALVDGLDVTVEIVAWSPVIVTGDIRAPGPYEFRPGMVAIQAAGLAGGTGAPLDDDSSLRRDTVAQQTALAVLQDEQMRLVGRWARLRAELGGQTELQLAEPRDPAWADVIRSEEQLLEIRRDRLARELSAIDSEAELYTAEIAALEQKLDALNRQLSLANEEAANAGDLAERGLVGNQRVFDTARILADIESQLLDVSTAMLAARQNLASAERERISLQDTRTAEVVEALQEVEGQLAETRKRIAGQGALLRELGAAGDASSSLEPDVSVLRLEAGELRRITDASLVPLRPGDIVEVIQPLPLGAEPDLGLVGLEQPDLPAPVQRSAPTTEQSTPSLTDPEPLSATVPPPAPQPSTRSGGQAVPAQSAEPPPEPDEDALAMDRPRVSPMSRPD
ncbi:polysaccharide biosynthesis/export family protein [Rubellimicrobium rubrum]|nr:polysaccharide biosynthesis/export family protein [Rubellimicrobium rubrum]